MGLQPFSRVLSGLSGDVLPALKAEGEKFDMIFIDGLHSFDVTLLDLFYSHALLKVGGTLLCDDMAWWQVAQAIDVFRKHHPGYKPCDAGQPGFTPMGVKSRMACFIKDAHEDETEVDFDYEWYKEVAAEFVAINGPAFDPLANKQNPPVYAKPWGSVGGGAWGNRLYKHAPPKVQCPPPPPCPLPSRKPCYDNSVKGRFVLDWKKVPGGPAITFEKFFDGQQAWAHDHCDDSKPWATDCQNTGKRTKCCMFKGMNGKHHPMRSRWGIQIFVAREIATHVVKKRFTRTLEVGMAQGQSVTVCGRRRRCYPCRWRLLRRCVPLVFCSSSRGVRLFAQARPHSR